MAATRGRRPREQFRCLGPSHSRHRSSRWTTRRTAPPGDERHCRATVNDRWTNGGYVDDSPLQGAEPQFGNPDWARLRRQVVYCVRALAPSKAAILTLRPKKNGPRRSLPPGAAHAPRALNLSTLNVRALNARALNLRALNPRAYQLNFTPNFAIRGGSTVVAFSKAVPARQLMLIAVFEFIRLYRSRNSPRRALLPNAAASRCGGRTP